MLEVLLIFLLQLIMVPILTLRTIFLVKNRSVAASGFGFLEALIYVFGLSLVFSGEQSIAGMLAYAFGFGGGIFIGGYVEGRLAIGYASFAVNLLEKNDELIRILRDEGFGVTVFEGQGRDSSRYQLDILTQRKREEELMKIIDTHEPKAFIISYEPRRLQGGFLVKAMKKNHLKKLKKQGSLPSE